MKLIKAKLSDLGFVGRGKSKHRPRNDASLYGGLFPFIQTGDVKAANFYLNEFSQTYNEKGLAQSKLWKKGTLLITIAANIGDTAILDIEACFPDSIVGFQAYKDIADVKYVKYYLDYIKLELEAISRGTTQDNMSLEKLLSKNLFVHQYQIQLKIASILSSYDELIDNNNQRIKLLEEMAGEIYKEWFVRLRFPGYETAKFFNEKGEEVKHGEVGGLPEGWKEVLISEAYITSSGGTPLREIDEYYLNGTINWVKTRELLDTFVFSTEERISELGLKNSSAKIFPLNTILMGMYGGVHGEGRKSTLGQLGILNDPSSTNQACCAFVPKNPETYSYPYLFHFLKSKRAEYLNMSMGAAQQNISQDIIKNSKYIQPLVEVINRFNLIEYPIFDEIKILMQKNQLLLQTRDLLLPRLISGKLSVEHLVEEVVYLPMAAEPEVKYNEQ